MSLVFGLLQIGARCSFDLICLSSLIKLSWEALNLVQVRSGLDELAVSPHCCVLHLTVELGWACSWMEALEWLSICIDMLHTPPSAPEWPVTDSLALSRSHSSILPFLNLPRLLSSSVSWTFPRFCFYLFTLPFVCPSQPVSVSVLFLPRLWTFTCHLL